MRLAPHAVFWLAATAPLAAQQPKRDTARSQPPPSRLDAMLVPLGAGLVLFGGISDSGTFFGDTWEWNGSRWRRLATPVAPSPRANTAAAYDVARREALLFGGNTFVDRLKETWMLKGSRWARVDSGAGPAGVEKHAMVYDTLRRRIVQFGGSAGKVVNDTWEWDGANWINVIPSGALPAPRSGHAMAYDAARQRVVLFGGQAGDGQMLGDTWEWDGTAWAEKTPPAAPSARAYHGMAYDRPRQRVVLFGGRGEQTLGDTWEWDGTSWEERRVMQAPGPREGHAMAYDATRKRAIVFGGSGDEGALNDTWGWNGTRWSLLARGRSADSAASHVAGALFWMRHDLGHLISAQRDHFAQHRRYTRRRDDLPDWFKRTTTWDVTLYIREATETGWAAYVTTRWVAGLQCGVFVGNVASPIPRAQREGEVYCGRSQTR